MAFLGLFGKPKQKPYTENELYNMEEAAEKKNTCCDDDHHHPPKPKPKIDSPLNVVISDGQVYGSLVDIIYFLKKYPKLDSDGLLYYMEESLKYVIKTNHNFKGKT